MTCWSRHLNIDYPPNVEMSKRSTSKPITISVNKSRKVRSVTHHSRNSGGKRKTELKKIDISNTTHPAVHDAAKLDEVNLSGLGESSCDVEIQPSSYLDATPALPSSDHIELDPFSDDTPFSGFPTSDVDINLADYPTSADAADNPQEDLSSATIVENMDPKAKHVRVSHLTVIITHCNH